MKKKKIVGLILLVIGVIVLIYALYARNRVDEIKGEVNRGTSMFGNNPVNRGISSAMDAKLGSYNAPILIGTIGGIALIVIGGGMILLNRKKR